MQRIQQNISRRLVLSVVFLALLSACQGDGKPSGGKSIADYVHDVDLARNVRDQYGKDKVKNKGNKDWEAASEATYKAQLLGECFAKNDRLIVTANADHDCLDRHGYKR